MIHRIALIALALLATACGPDLPERSERWTGTEAGWSSGSEGEQVRPELPVDVPPPILAVYRFAPGDQMTIRLYGFPDQNRAGITVDADGAISYLTARSVPAAGRTVAELRSDLQDRLAALYMRPLVAVEPTLVVGHRYLVLGKVVDKGSYPIDRPLRLLDAIARARGIETGLLEGSTVEIADFDHAFLLRGGAPLPIDFKALIQDGDLRWNIHVHPGDVLYFPSTVSSEVWVYGAAANQGPQAYSTGMTLLTLLTRRGGVLEKAYRSRIVVLRGGLSAPRIITVDLDEVLAARVRDLPILPGDVVYVPDRPFQSAREVAVIALRAFAAGIGGAAAADAANLLRITP